MQTRLRPRTTSGLEALLAHESSSLFASHFVPYSTSTEVLTFRCAIAWPTCAFRGSHSRGTRCVISIIVKTKRSWGTSTYGSQKKNPENPAFVSTRALPYLVFLPLAIKD